MKIVQSNNRHLFLSLVFLLHSNIFYAQESILSNQLSVGDIAPNYSFDTILNYNKTSASLSDFKGKLVILDFWTRNCGSCIADMPRKAEVQSRFKNKEVVILPVNYENLNSSIIEAFLKRKLQNVNLPFVLDYNQVLFKSLPNPGGPGMQAWIDGDGTIVGLTTDEYVNELEIRKKLNKEPVNWPIYKRIEFDYESPLTRFDENFFKEQLDWIVFSNHLNYVNTYSKYEADSLRKTKRLTFINFSIRDLLLYNFGQNNIFPLYENRILVRSKTWDLQFKHQNYYEGWWANNTFCFEIGMPISVTDSLLYQRSLSEIQRQYKVSIKLKNIKTLCLVLEKGEKKISESEGRASSFNSLDDLVKSLNENTFVDMPVILGKKISGFTSIALKIKSWKDKRQVINELQRNGLYLREKELVIPMLVIEDNFVK